MDLHGFDLNLLVALDALLAEKSVTNAGRRVHLSQSAMSGVLARLRHALNDKLLVASRGGMTLTPLAESLVEPVRSILEQVHRTILVNVPFDPATSRRVFTIAASDYAVTVLLTDALRRVAGTRPVSLLSSSRCGNGHRSPTISGSISSSFRRRTRQPPCRTRFCSKTRSRPLCGAGIRVWATRFTRISIVAFRTPWSASPTTRASTTTSAWRQAGFELHAQVVAPSYHALPALIVGTDRIATLQMRLAEKLAASYPIRVVPLPLPLPVLEEAMMWHPRLDRDAGHAWLRGVLRETAAALPAMGRAVHGAVQHRPRRRPA